MPHTDSSEALARRIRLGEDSEPPAAADRLVRDRPFDETPVPGTSPADIDPALVGRFMRDEAGPTELALRKLRIIAYDDDGNARLTVSGVLLGTRQPQTWMPHAGIQAVSYASDRREPRYQTDARDIQGPLDAQVMDGLNFVRRNMFIRATKHLAREEFPQFSERVVFEALVNAVAHRDYSMAGARVRLHLFADRLELYVPGALANTLTPESMALRQYSRNELIVSLLARCPVDPETGVGRRYLMDRRGDGVPIILDESRRLSGRSPEYSLIDDAELRLVIWEVPSPF